MMEYQPYDPDTAPEDNREPGILIVPGSNFVKEVSKFEQFHTKFTMGTQPGNPYRYRPFPKMLYRAQRLNGSPTCFAPPVDPLNYRDPREAERAELQAQRFNETCQMVVKDEVEMSRAMESNWRESPQEAVEALIARDKGVVDEWAHREHTDKHMSPMAKREIAAAKEAVEGEPTPEIPSQSVRKAETTVFCSHPGCKAKFSGKRARQALAGHRRSHQ